MKFLIVLFALIGAAFAAPQFFPGLGGSFSGSQSAAQAQSGSFGFGNGLGGGLSGSQSAAAAQSASFGTGFSAGG